MARCSCSALWRSRSCFTASDSASLRLMSSVVGALGLAPHTPSLTIWPATWPPAIAPAGVLMAYFMVKVKIITKFFGTLHLIAYLCNVERSFMLLMEPVSAEYVI